MAIANPESRANTSRHNFLKRGGALVVTFALRPGKSATALAESRPKTVAPDEVDGFLAIDAHGRVTVYSGKVDLGTGLETALTQIAAEELSVPFDHVTVIQGDTALTPDQGITWGSLSIQNGGTQIRRAAATAREALLAEVAKVNGVPREALTLKDGVISSSSGAKSWSYAELVGGRNLNLKLDAKAPLKDPKDYSIVGRPVARVDVPAKVTGQFTYMQDFTVKGMIHARVIRPGGVKAALLTWSDAKARPGSGLPRRGAEGEFPGGARPQRVGSHQGEPRHRGHVGLARPARAGAAQQTHLLRQQLANMLGMQPADVRCIYVEGAGCYGRNGHEDAAADAALLAKQTELPVRVQWMRQDEHWMGPKRPTHPDRCACRNRPQ